MFHTSFFPTNIRVFFFCAGKSHTSNFSLVLALFSSIAPVVVSMSVLGTCGLVFFFRFIAAGNSVSTMGDAFAEYIAENIQLTKEMIAQLRDRDGWVAKVFGNSNNSTLTSTYPDNTSISSNSSSSRSSSSSNVGSKKIN